MNTNAPSDGFVDDNNILYMDDNVNSMIADKIEEKW